MRLALFILFLLYSCFVSSLEIKSWKTGQGSVVMFYNTPEIPMADIRLVFSAGSTRDGKKYGLSRMANKLLLEGSGDLNSKQFKDKLSETGAQLYVGSMREMAFINMRTLTDLKYFEPAVDLLISAVSSPVYSKPEVDKVIGDMLVDLSLKDESPSQIAQEAIWSEIYKGHPYSNYPGGKKSSISSITSSQLLEFHRSYYVAKNATIAIVGDLTEVQAKNLAEKISSSLPQGKKAPKIPEFNSFTSSNVHIETNSDQIHLRIGSLGISRNDKDYFPMILGNHILGGGSLVSLLFEEIRNKRGLSYSVYSYFIPTEIVGPFVLGLQTSGKQRKIALDESMRVLRNFIEKGPSVESFNLAKKNLISGFINQIDSNQKLIGYISMIGFYQLPLNYLETFSNKVKEVSITDVSDAFQRRMTKNFTVVTVGRKQ